MTFAKDVESSDIQQCSSESAVIASNNSPSIPVAGSSTNSLPLTARISPGKMTYLRHRRRNEICFGGST